MGGSDLRRACRRDRGLRHTGRRHQTHLSAAGLWLLPRPQRFYFRFGPPIETAPYGGRTDDAACAEVRDATRDAVETGIAHLRRRRRADPARFLALRLAGRALGWLDGAPRPSIDDR